MIMMESLKAANGDDYKNEFEVIQKSVFKNDLDFVDLRKILEF